MGPKLPPPRKRTYFEDLDGADMSKASLEELQDYVRQVYDTVQQNRLERDCLETETNNIIKYWRRTLIDLLATAREARHIEQEIHTVTEESAKKALDGEWANKLERWEQSKEIGEVMVKRAEIRKVRRDRLNTRDFQMFLDVRQTNRQARAETLAVSERKAEIDKDKAWSKTNARDLVKRHNDYREGNAQRRILDGKKELQAMWDRDQKEALETVALTHQVTMGHLAEQRKVMTGYGDIHTIYLVHIKTIKADLTAALAENTKAKKRHDQLLEARDALLDRITYLNDNIKRYKSELSKTPGNPKSALKKVLGIEALEELKLSSSVYLLNRLQKKLDQYSGCTQKRADRTHAEITALRIDTEKRRIVAAQQRDMLRFLVQKCNGILGLREERKTLGPDYLSWSKRPIDESEAWEEYDRDRMTYNNLYELYRRYFARKGTKTEDLGYLLEKNILL